jgi:hypothetical protein
MFMIHRVVMREIIMSDDQWSTIKRIGNDAYATGAGKMTHKERANEGFVEFVCPSAQAAVGAVVELFGWRRVGRKPEALGRQV